jgi:hypothetical protein
VFWFVATLFLAIYVIGVVASVFLFFSAATWACWVIGFIAIKNIAGSSYKVIWRKSNFFKEIILLIISVGSVILLIAIPLGLHL